MSKTLQFLWLQKNSYINLLDCWNSQITLIATSIYVFYVVSSKICNNCSIFMILSCLFFLFFIFKLCTILVFLSHSRRSQKYYTNKNSIWLKVNILYNRLSGCQHYLFNLSHVHTPNNLYFFLNAKIKIYYHASHYLYDKVNLLSKRIIIFYSWIIIFNSRYKINFSLISINLSN